MRLFLDSIYFVINLVSIHASVKDATPYMPILASCSFSFNPRIRKGCDYDKDSLFEAFIVSIHASVKDATGLPSAGL